MKIKINDCLVEVQNGATYSDAAAALGLEKDALAVMVRGETLSLNAVCKEADAHILTYFDEEGKRVYERSIRFVMLMAFERLYPGAFVRCEHSLGRGIYVTVRGMKLTEDVITNIRECMKSIVKADLPFTLLPMSRKEAIAHYANRGDEDKVKLLKYRPFEHFRMYECGGMKEYFYGEMARSTGSVSVFDVRLVGGGFVVLLPDENDPTRLSEYRPMPKLLSTFRESARWHEILEVENAADLNEMTEKGHLREFIRVNEALMDRKIYEIADKIVESRARLVCIAGPSSSGKTTFCNRLMIALRVTGLTPVKLSLDDYYKNRDQIPLDEHGEVDLECVESLDTELLGKHLTQLLDGEQVEAPTYDFLTGMRTDKTHLIKVDPTSPILIEGIHGLNDRLTPGIRRNMKFKIYISALTTLNIDDHNRIRTTDARLIRRIVRDAAFRGTDPEKTFSMWASVRRGEEKNIFPFQEDADAMINSSLAYELAVVKNYAYPILTAITPDNQHYTAARRLVKFLNYIRSADVEDEIPLNSILREFIGGSCFYREE
ncbi:MAG: nucleoside kinase [Clostridia bacterium]|nr:nucleoside kinase [Clostridia bacterium]